MFRTLALHPKLKLLRLCLYCFVSMILTFALAIAQEEPPATPASRDFLVRLDPAQSGPAFRVARSTLRAEGKRSLVYVEDKLWNEQGEAFTRRLGHWLESALPAAAIRRGTGLVEFLEQLFGKLPASVSGEARLVVLVASLGPAAAGGYQDATDRLSDKEARKLGRRSNELNIIYIDPHGENPDAASGTVARELQRLLSEAHAPSPREPWLADALAEGAMLLAGFFGSQPQVDSFARDSGRQPLVASALALRGPQLLFGSFVLDSFPNLPRTSLGYLASHKESGRGAIEALFRENTGIPRTFDAIFSNFVTYVFSMQRQSTRLPSSWRHGHGIKIPGIQPYFQFKVGSGELNGMLVPFSFVAVDLMRPLSPFAQVILERPKNLAPAPAAGSCADTASLLWKPITPSRIAIYAVGCDPEPGNAPIPFRLRILDQPSLLLHSPLTMLR